MPYEIIKSVAGGKKGYRVKNKKSGKFYSKESLPLNKAKKQRTAIILEEIKQKPKNYKKGGIVKNTANVPPIQGRKKDYGDVVPAILEPGELVIPVEHVKTVKNHLKNKNIKLPGMSR